ncbi:ABC transporter permease [Rhizobium sp. CSW-27]|uniref:ABC transporter permease n=1 Tax=Rhizobium sp. CSW-27 TaxID=2839985 RepID=UPI001C035359|nr:ABC transporter permease [Rhizobium sp. CSW-27]MBT9369394.1 ABC transporter permease [Rhizobium sp. CSW-27]
MNVMRLVLALIALAALALASLFLGVSEVSPLAVLSGTADEKAMLVIWASRVPRTIALMLAGAGLAVSGTLMQMLARNRFVEPSTAGTVESAGLGMLIALIVSPTIPVIGKMLFASAFALAGTALFLAILRRIPLRSIVMVPLVGLMLGGVIYSISAFIAYRLDMMQSLAAFDNGDFSAVLRGRYEILWLAFALTVAAYVAADRFTLAGLGEEFSTNLGLNYRRIMTFGLVIVSMVTASVVVTAGVIPFLGLIVPNVVSMPMGDSLRRTLPWIAILGAGLVLVCDMVGRIVIAPFEIPVGAVLGVIGSAFFLYLILRRKTRAA